MPNYTNNINITLYTSKRPSILHIFNTDKKRGEGRGRREKRWGWEVSADFCYQEGTLDSAMVKKTQPNLGNTGVRTDASVPCTIIPTLGKGGGRPENLYYIGFMVITFTDWFSDWLLY